ncbi:hypothetical protein NP233_g7098 [Leucocoprinus birnbaumii]|uniref:Uncharacterized protein n=1 Tax=Leucocoprinus birnbaumii TaxID=56174 RepID=A0AAD5VS84_9AGAR|nr:hypothetical protein NP233_g7098 [Leucocoprinus birnbaumii]
MFSKFASFITTGLVLAGAASAMPASHAVEERAAEAGVNIQLCLSVNFGNCITVPAVTGSCVNLVGGLAGWNDDVSGVQIPLGFVCTFYDNFSCLSSGASDNGDSVTLQGGNWPSFFSVPGDNGVNVNWNDRTSSFLCTPLI